MGAASASFTLPTFLRAKTFASNTFQSEPSFFVQGSPCTPLKEVFSYKGSEVLLPGFVQGSPCTPLKEPSFFVQGSPCTPLKEPSFFVQGSPCTPARFLTWFA
ncbi:MAG TPA: hypothetical protein ENG03_00630 [Thioploca sp.]|nr:hypothetical protein [Thioploca sp.]